MLGHSERSPAAAEALREKAAGRIACGAFATSLHSQLTMLTTRGYRITVDGRSRIYRTDRVDRSATIWVSSGVLLMGEGSRILRLAQNFPRRFFMDVHAASRSIGFVIGGYDRRCGLRPSVKQTVGRRPACESMDRRATRVPFGVEPVGVPTAVPLQQAMGLQFPQVVPELGGV
jgi:hypothetical protein